VQSPGNLVRLLSRDKSHDVIQTRIHDEMSQPLCLTPTQFGNFEVLRLQRDALCTINDVLHRKRRLKHNDMRCIDKRCLTRYDVVLHQLRRLTYYNIVLHRLRRPTYYHTGCLVKNELIL
jgi:hypothetical protein